MVKKIHVDMKKEDISLIEVQNVIREIKEKYPDRDVFFDGDEYAICSRKRDVRE